MGSPRFRDTEWPTTPAADSLHGDDTTVPLLARGKTVTARLWTYVRDDRPFAGPAPPAAMFRYSREGTGGQEGPLTIRALPRFPWHRYG